MESISRRLKEKSFNTMQEIFIELSIIKSDEETLVQKISKLCVDIKNCPDFKSGHQLIERLDDLENEETDLLSAKHELRAKLVELNWVKLFKNEQEKQTFINLSQHKSNQLSMISSISPLDTPINLNAPIERGKFITNNEWEIDPNKLKIDSTKTLGQGQFGTVVLGSYLGKEVAIKKLLLQSFSDPVKEKEFIREMKILATLRHPNLLLFMGACTKPGNMMMVTEVMQKGSLFDIIHKKNSEITLLSLRRRILIAQGIAQGMNSLHSLNPPILHLDLKSANVLIDENFVPKVADFGLSILDREEHKEMVGSPFYMSPEVFTGFQYDTKADIYSFGILLWEIMTLKEPYEGKYTTLPDLKHGVTKFLDRPRILNEFCSRIKDLLPVLWAPKPQNRVNFEQILNEHIFEDIVIDTLIPSNVAKYMWKQRFFGKWTLKWNSELQPAIRNFLQIGREIMDSDVRWECLKVFLRLEGSNSVTIEQFAEMLEWIGPFDKKLPERAYEMIKSEYFYGFIPALRAGELLNSEKKAGVFLIRVSSIPGSFTLSQMTKTGDISHYRIQYTDGKFHFAGSKYDSLDHLIKEARNNKKHTLYPLKHACKHPTPFAPMLQRKQNEQKKGKTEEDSIGNYLNVDQ